jgi:hypothetical protein
MNDLRKILETMLSDTADVLRALFEVFATLFYEIYKLVKYFYTPWNVMLLVWIAVLILVLLR